MMNKKELTQVPALSCVERYFLAWLNRVYDIAQLYGNSFVSLGQVCDDFARGATYENYCYIPRLQDVAEEYGIVKHRFWACGEKDARGLLAAQSADELYLVRVNPRFFTGFKRTAWREDHYVCVDSSLRWINEYPLSEGEFTAETFAERFDGAVCAYSAEDLTNVPEDFCTSAIKNQSFENVRLPRGLKELEATLGILRVTRKRLKKYYAGQKAVCEALKEEIALLDKLYFSARLKRIKRENGGEGPRELLGQAEKIVEIEKKVSEALE